MDLGETVGKIFVFCNVPQHEELRAEQTAHCESKENIAKMAVELKDAPDRYR